MEPVTPLLDIAVVVFEILFLGVYVVRKAAIVASRWRAPASVFAFRRSPH
jgi:hypothetical protein